MTERVDPVTGEIVTEVPKGLQRLAADGNPVPRTARSASDCIALLEDGEFNADVSAALRDLVQKIEAHAHNNKGVGKGSLTIKIDLSVANGVFVLVGDYKTKEPVQKRLGTALFSREDGALGRNPPGQNVLFGARDVTIDSETRDI